LHWAALNGHGDVVAMLLAAGLRANAATEHAKRPLHVAAQNGHVLVVRILLLVGADAFVRTDNDQTPLHKAAANGHSGVAWVLMQACDDFEDVARRLDDTHKPAAAAAGLLERRAPPLRLDAAIAAVVDECKRGLLPSTPDQVAALGAFLERNAATTDFTALHPNDGSSPITTQSLLTLADECGTTALHLAAGGGHSAAAVFLANSMRACDALAIEMRSNVLPGYGLETSPLGMDGVLGVTAGAAAGSGALVRAGGAPLPASRRRSHGNESLVALEALGDRRADRLAVLGSTVASSSANSWGDGRDGGDEGEALVAAEIDAERPLPVVVGDATLGSALVTASARRGASALGAGSGGVSPLIPGGGLALSAVPGGTMNKAMAEVTGHLLSDFIKEHGTAKANKARGRGCTPLMVAVCSGHDDVVQGLLAAGADVRTRNVFGETCLRVASWRGHAKIVKLLLEAGADAELAEDGGGSVLRSVPFLLFAPILAAHLFFCLFCSSNSFVCPQRGVPRPRRRRSSSPQVRPFEPRDWRRRPRGRAGGAGLPRPGAAHRERQGVRRRVQRAPRRGREQRCAGGGRHDEQHGVALRRAARPRRHDPPPHRQGRVHVLDEQGRPHAAHARGEARPAAGS
jgi:ankyrin repeat protein